MLGMTALEVTGDPGMTGLLGGVGAPGMTPGGMPVQNPPLCCT